MSAETLALITEGRAEEGRRRGRGAACRDHGGEADGRPDPALPPPADDQGRRRDRPRTPTCRACASTATVKTAGQTGVEMEALTAVSTACLTIYDMVKAVEKDMEIGGIRAALKDGGKSGRCEAPT